MTDEPEPEPEDETPSLLDELGGDTAHDVTLRDLALPHRQRAIDTLVSAMKARKNVTHAAKVAAAVKILEMTDGADALKGRKGKESASATTGRGRMRIEIFTVGGGDEPDEPAGVDDVAEFLGAK